MDIKTIAEKFNFKTCSTMPLRTVFTAQSKAFFYCKDAICEFVFQNERLPVNPFMVFDYFLNDRVDRDLIRRANNHLLSICDEVWIFGDISNGVMFEIIWAKKLKKPVRYFSIATKSNEIVEVTLSDLTFENELSLTKEQIAEFILLVT